MTDLKNLLGDDDDDLRDIVLTKEDMESDDDDILDPTACVGCAKPLDVSEELAHEATENVPDETGFILVLVCTNCMTNKVILGG